MDIPLEMLIDYMGYLNPELRLKERDLWITGIKMMPEDRRLDSNYVYFAQLNGQCFSSEHAPFVFVCPKDVVPDDNLTNCIILHTDVPLAVVFNEILGVQTLLRDWGQNVELSISRHEGVQRLLDLGGRVFGNPIAVITSSFKTIAATWEYETEEPVFWELFELGYLTQDTFNRLKSIGYFSPARLTGETLVVNRNDTISHDSAITAVTNEGAVVFIVLMLCSNTSVSRGLLQLFNFFIEKLRTYLQPAAVKGDYIRNQFNYFIIDIIEGRVTTPREISERSIVYPPAYTTEYSTVLISHESSSPMYLEHAMNNLSAVFPNIRQILYDNYIILHPDLTSSESRKTHFLATLSAYLGGARAYAGISEASTGLETIRESFRQARDALNLGRRLMRSQISSNMLQLDQSQARVFHFRDYQVYNMLTGTDKEIGILDTIRQYDLSHNSDYFRILFIFLSLERNYTKSAALLHMHRNNVIYHTKRIVEIFNLDLEDAGQRLRLLLLYRLYDLLSLE